MKKVRLNIIISFLLILEVFSLFLAYQSLNKKDVILIPQKNYSNQVFAMLLEQEDGLYKESTDKKWPTGKYVYNEKLSKCTDMHGNILNGILNYNTETKVASVTTDTTVSCYLYFDLDLIPPQVENFYIGDASNQEYVTNKSTKLYASWSDDDVESYCLTENSSHTNCLWNSINGNTLNITYDLGNTDRVITKYLYLRDYAGNISLKTESTITLDTTTPTVKTFYIGGSTNPTYATNKSTKLYASWSDDDVASYCVSYISAITGCTWVTTNGKGLDVAYDLNYKDGPITMYFYIKDKAGHVSLAKQDDIILDTTAPTIQNFYLGGSSNPSTTTNDSSIYAKWEEDDVASYCITTTNNISTCTWNGISGKTLNISYNIIESGNITRYLFLKDKVGHVSKAVMDTVTIPIAYAIYSDTDKSLTFIRSDVVLTEGGTYNNKIITSLYTGFEEATYSSKIVGDIQNLESVSTAPWGTRKEITNINFEDEIKPISTAYWFAWLNNVSNINVKNLNTSNVTDMTSMFQEIGINVNDVSVVGFDSWDTSKVENMSYMFSYIGALDLDLSKFNVSNVTNMTGMFKNAASKCISKTFSLSSISSWIPSKVENMSSMFANIGYNQRTCDIVLGDLSSWNTSNVTNMSEMFHLSGYFSKSFKVNGIGNWDVSNVTNMSRMFAHVSYNVSDSCYIGDLSGWKTGKVLGMYRMFYYAAAGQSSCSIGNISSWDVSNVTTMEEMFYYGEAVAKPALDLSSWNVANVKKYNWFVHSTNDVITPPKFGTTTS